MGKSKSRRHQKVYKMRGCSKKTRKHRRRKYLGGSDSNLAYTGKPVVNSGPNPFLSYTGKGGAPDLAKSMPAAFPSAGPVGGPGGKGVDFVNPPLQKGGQCGSCGLMKGGLMKGGSMVGGGCGCGLMQGGGADNTSNNGIPYPNGLVGNSITPSVSSWPGVNNVSGGSNHYPLNKYEPVDISRQMQAIGANPPFNGAPLKGGRRRRNSRKQRGGALNFSNFLSQDLVNLGRQGAFGLGSVYNGLTGQPSGVNPMPWKGQMPATANINTIHAAFR
jgi:hypothetical protein